MLSAAFLLQSRNSALAGSSGSSGSSTTGRPRPRRPIARVDATTYRPAARLRPGAPVISAFESPAGRLPLHRRADSYTPPSEQLVSIQSSKELAYKEDGSLEPVDNQPQQHEPPPAGQQPALQAALQPAALQHQQQLQQQQAEYQRLLREQAALQQRQQQIERQQRLLSEQIYYSQQEPLQYRLPTRSQ